MRALVVGLGSMGKRRIRNLHHLGVSDVVGCDAREDRRRDAEAAFGIRTVAAFEDAMQDRPDVVLVCTPPDRHVPFALEAARAGIPFFTELNLLRDGWAEVAAAQRPGTLAAPSATLRFQPSVRRVRDLLQDGDVGQPLTFTYHAGQYLPDWHPWEDYRSFFASQRATGGCREIAAIELGWLTWVFGPVDRVTCMKDKRSDLDADIEDVYQIVLRFRSGVLGHLAIDVLSRVPTRHLRVVGSRGTLEWVAAERVVRVRADAKDQGRVHAEPASEALPDYANSEAMYVDEMRHFLAAVSGREEYHYTIHDEQVNLAVLEAAEASADSGRHVDVQELAR